jgi:hypothetical protein
LYQTEDFEMSDEQKTAEIIPFPGLTRHNLDANDMLKFLAEDDAPLEMLVCVAMTPDGEIMVATSQTHDGDTMMLLTRAQDTVISKYRYDN